VIVYFVQFLKYAVVDHNSGYFVSRWRLCINFDKNIDLHFYRKLFWSQCRQLNIKCRSKGLCRFWD
jgi:hypothetical protein